MLPNVMFAEGENSTSRQAAPQHRDEIGHIGSWQTSWTRGDHRGIVEETTRVKCPEFRLPSERREEKASVE